MGFCFVFCRRSLILGGLIKEASAGIDLYMFVEWLRSEKVFVEVGSKRKI